MKRQRLLLAVMMLLSWASIPLIGKRSFKRFLPASIFICTIAAIMNIPAAKRKWWVFQSSIHPKIRGDVPFVIGPYFVLSFLVLKYMYGKFGLYMIVNFVLHILYAFPGVRFLEWAGIASLKKMTKQQFILLQQFRAVLLYGFQVLYEKLRSSDPGEQN
ncbi:hypothetical protein SFC50_07500 [Bacillus infantis]|uniref:hypothetical protein n=1 Tax=Bacillus infantis TaxID=324767 RepID=UPI003981F256